MFAPVVMHRLVAAVALLALLACERADVDHRRPPPVPAPVKPDPVKAAHDEFELIASDYAAGTSLMYSRADFMSSTDERAALDEGDFLGRFRALFGARDGDEYVLRHRKTGFLIVGYAGKSGPAFGGGPRYPGALPAPGTMPPMPDFATEQAAIQARINADPVLAHDPMTESPPTANATPTTREKWSRDYATYNRHMNDARAPAGFPEVAHRLEDLLEAVTPADWEATRYYEDEPTVYRVGVRHGTSFEDEVAPTQGLEYLLGLAEAAPAPARDHADDDGDAVLGPDHDVVDYAVKYATETAALAPRVQRAWLRWAHAIARAPADEREPLLRFALTTAAKLGISAAAANAALTAK